MVRVRVFLCVLLVLFCGQQCFSQFVDSEEGHSYVYVDKINPENEDQVICIDDGCLKGKLETGNDKEYEAFYGIPFAAPPVDKLRFQSPVRPDSWVTTYDATFPRSPCMQADYSTKEISGSEDCLYLNVYRPNKRQIKKKHKKNKPLPVLVFIHGGSFKALSAHPTLFGPDYFMDTQEVIVVTIQYRLNVFGFLACGETECKGNYGLKDQNMALRWVNENIRAFGGDPRKVTLMGQSAGSASVQYQIMSKRSDGLFNRAIMLSGSALASWALDKTPQKTFRAYAQFAGVPNALTASPSFIVNELRKKTAQELIEIHESVPIPINLSPLFRPVVEGYWYNAFIRDDPEKIWKNGNYQHRQFLTGVTGYEEGSYDQIYYNETFSDFLQENMEEFLGSALELPPTALAQLIKYYESTDPVFGEGDASKFLKIRDRLWDYPMYKTVKYFVQYANLAKRPADVVHFNFSSTFSTSFLTNPLSVPERGAAHGDDLLYLFRFKAFDPSFVRGPAEDKMKDFYVRFFVDYVKDGQSRLNRARICIAKDFIRPGFCDYMDIQRDGDRIRVYIKDDFDLKMVAANKLVERLANQNNLSTRPRFLY